jgi:hypothetical protein
MLDRDHAEGHTSIRAHLLGLTQVDLQLYEPALDVARIRTVGRVIACSAEMVDGDGAPIAVSHLTYARVP